MSKFEYIFFQRRDWKNESNIFISALKQLIKKVKTEAICWSFTTFENLPWFFSASNLNGKWQHGNRSNFNTFSWYQWHTLLLVIPTSYIWLNFPWHFISHFFLDIIIVLKKKKNSYYLKAFMHYLKTQVNCQKLQLLLWKFLINLLAYYLVQSAKFWTVIYPVSIWNE